MNMISANLSSPTEIKCKLGLEIMVG